MIIEEQVAKAIKMQQELHEDSYIPSTEKDARGHPYPGKYTRDEEDCWQEACGQAGLPKRLWYILYLAGSFMNDLDWWADETLAHPDVEVGGSEPKVDPEQDSLASNGKES